MDKNEDQASHGTFSLHEPQNEAFAEHHPPGKIEGRAAMHGFSNFRLIPTTRERKDDMFHSLESLNRIIEEVGKRDGIPDLRLSPQGTAAVRFQGGIRVMFEYVEATGMLYLYCPLLPLPVDPGQRAFIMEAMLEANFLRLHTGAGEFSVMRKEAQAIYQMAFEAGRLDVALVSDGIDSLLRQHAECLHIIESWEPVHAQPSRGTARPPGGIGRLARPGSLAKPGGTRMRRL